MTVQIDRRSFLASITAVGGSLSLGFEVPFGPVSAHAADSEAADPSAAWDRVDADACLPEGIGVRHFEGAMRQLNGRMESAAR